jgi:hypothetical protein
MLGHSSKLDLNESVSLHDETKRVNIIVTFQS